MLGYPKRMTEYDEMRENSLFQYHEQEADNTEFKYYNPVSAYNNHSADEVNFIYEIGGRREYDQELR